MKVVRMQSTVLMATAALAVLLPGVRCKTFRPQDHGAQADGHHNDTAAVLAAVAAATACGAEHHPGDSFHNATDGCELLFSGGTFLTGPFVLPSHSVVTVAEGATVMAMAMKEWHAAGWTVGAFLTGTSLSNLTIQGTGTIDGNGADWWAVTHDDLHYRPGMLSLGSTHGLVIQDVMFLNSPNHNIMLHGCVGVRVQRIRVEAPYHSPNTDGINFGGGHDQSIVDSTISNGDDCVSIVCSDATMPAPAGAGEGQIPFGGDVIVRNLTCIGGHGVSIGSIRHGYVRNVSVSQVHFIGSDNGARIKTYPNHTGLVADISYSDIKMTNVSNPILIDGSYCPKSQKPYPCPPGPVAVLIRNISFNSIEGTGSSTRVGDFGCSSVSPCRDLKLNHVHLDTTRAGAKAAFSCSNAHGPAAVSATPKSCITPDDDVSWL